MDIFNKKLALFIFVIVLIIPSYVSANLDFYKEGSQYYIRYYDADEQAYNSVAFPSECSIVGSPQHYLGARVAIVFADCSSQGPKAYFYDSYWNEWTAETPDGEFTSGADSYAVGAAGVNVAVIAIGNANDRVAYAYDYNKKELFPYRGSAGTILGNAPFKASAGKNNGLIASVYDEYAYAYSTEVGWKQYSFSLPLKEMGSANEFSALVGDDNVYLYKSGLSNLVYEDFDQTKVIHSVMNLEQKFKESGKDFIVVPGNHDYGVFYNEIIYSNTLNKQGKNISELHNELQEDYEARHYLFNLLTKKSHGVETTIGEYSTYVVHGGLGGSLMSYIHCPAKLEDLWFRIDYGKYDYPKNFKKMEEKEYGLLIRGHDHHRMYGFELEGGSSEGLFVTEGGKFKLADSKRHVINPGAWFEGDYLIIDDLSSKLMLDFRNVDE